MDKVDRILRDYVSGTILSVQIVTGYGARLSAAGYMDCTEWSVFSSVDAAKEYLRETYHDDETDEADEDEDTAAQLSARNPQGNFSFAGSDLRSYSITIAKRVTRRNHIHFPLDDV